MLVHADACGNFQISFLSPTCSEKQLPALGKRKADVAARKCAQSQSSKALERVAARAFKARR
eukprot:5864691-Pleurochrysis_carterae.AAC.1